MLSVVIPVYNEELLIQETVSNILKELDKLDFELILVDNGSFDKTPQILKRIRNKRVRVVTLKKNVTFGGGVLTGLAVAKGDRVCITCADDQVKAQEITKLYDIATKHDLDYCKADRKLHYEKWFRRFASRVYKGMVKGLFFLKTRDINGYPIIMKHGVYKNINPRQGNWIINVELLYNARKRRIKVVEVPIEYRDRSRGKSHVDFKVVWSMFADLIKYRTKTLINK